MLRIISILFLITACSSYKPTIFIDAGHGGPEDPGIVIKGEKEAPINLMLAKKIKNSILNLEKGYNVELIRKTNSFISLQERIQVVSEKYKSGDIFISIHQNAARTDIKNNIIIFTKNKEDVKLADAILWLFKYSKLQIFKNREIKQANFYVLNNPLPSVLIEVNRMNKGYRDWISIETNQEKVADIIAVGIYVYFYNR